MSEGREKCVLARVSMSVGILWLFHWRNGPPWRGLLTEWWDSGSQQSAKCAGRTFFFSYSALLYQKEKSSLPYERLLNTRCLNVLYYFCLF